MQNDTAAGLKMMAVELHLWPASSHTIVHEIVRNLIGEVLSYWHEIDRWDDDGGQELSFTVVIPSGTIM